MKENGSDSNHWEKGTDNQERVRSSTVSLSQNRDWEEKIERDAQRIDVHAHKEYRGYYYALFYYFNCMFYYLLHRRLFIIRAN